MVTSFPFTHILFLFFAPWIFAQRSSINVQFQLTEECPEGTLVGCLSDDINLHAQSYLTSHPSEESYQLLTATKLFELDSTSGTIKTKSRIDREEICSSSQKGLFASTVEAAEMPCFIAPTGEPFTKWSTGATSHSCKNFHTWHQWQRPHVARGLY